MVQESFTIRNPAGLDLKQTAALCTESIKYESSVYLNLGNARINGKSVLNVLSACVKCDDVITLVCEGSDEEEALKNIGKLISEELE